MDKRYQVFVSSTFLDLVEERREVMQALLKLECIPAGMELFNATDQDQWELIKSVIDDSDYYVLIVGARYGSITPDGISYTEKEYDYAGSRDKRILRFIHAQPGSIPIDKGEQTDEGKRKLDAFVEKVLAKPVVRYASPGELAGQVGLSLASEIRKFPQVGWVRGDNAMTPEIESEISALRAQLARSELSRERANISPIADMATLSQGDDSVSIAYARVGDDGVAGGWKKCQTTWNRLLKLAGTSLVGEMAEDALTELILEQCHVQTWRRDNAPERIRIVGNMVISRTDSDKIINQFRSLGYLERGVRQRPVKDTATYWKLTELGEVKLAELMAVRRKSTGEASK